MNFHPRTLVRLSAYFPFFTVESLTTRLINGEMPNNSKSRLNAW